MAAEVSDKVGHADAFGAGLLEMFGCKSEFFVRGHVHNHHVEDIL